MTFKAQIHQKGMVIKDEQKEDFDKLMKENKGKEASINIKIRKGAK